MASVFWEYTELTGRGLADAVMVPVVLWEYTELRDSTEFEACRVNGDTMLTGLTIMPLADGGIGNSDGEGDMGVGASVVGTTVIVAESDIVPRLFDNDDDDGAATSLLAAVGSVSTTVLAEEKSGSGTKGEFLVLGTLDFHLSNLGSLGLAAKDEGR